MKKKRVKVLIIILAAVLVFIFVVLWIHGFQITKFIPRRGYA